MLSFVIVSSTRSTKAERHTRERSHTETSRGLLNLSLPLSRSCRVAIRSAARCGQPPWDAMASRILASVCAIRGVDLSRSQGTATVRARSANGPRHRSPRGPRLGLSLLSLSSPVSPALTTTPGVRMDASRATPPARHGAIVRSTGERAMLRPGPGSGRRRRTAPRPPGRSLITVAAGGIGTLVGVGDKTPTLTSTPCSLQTPRYYGRSDLVRQVCAVVWKDHVGVLPPRRVVASYSKLNLRQWYAISGTCGTVHALGDALSGLAGKVVLAASRFAAPKYMTMLRFS